jgi:hypothetical protein
MTAAIPANIMPMMKRIFVLNFPSFCANSMVASPFRPLF